MRRAAIYCRISQDRAGAGLGVARQEADCRALTERRGWQVADVYSDNDVSAYSGSPRPAWRRLLEDIDAGTVDAIVCWHVDRLTRSPRELEDVIDLADRRGIELATVTGEIDLATPTGRLIARMLGAAARHEAEHKAERQKRQRRQNAEAGKVSGGGMRPYGYAEDRLTVIEEEAEVIREAARRILAGESLSSVCKDFEQRDVKTPSGRHWIPTTLRRLLASARISGRREHTPRSTFQTTRPLLGEIVADAVWPAIIDPVDSDRLRALLSDPARDYRRQAATGRIYLLSGILRCGRCGHRMNGRPRQGVPRYVCPNVPGSGSCGGIATNTARTDDHIRDMLLTALDSPALAERIRHQGGDDDNLAEAVRADEELLEELAQAWATREITRREWMAARAPIELRLDKNRAQLAGLSRTSPLIPFIGTAQDMLTRWEAMNVSQRRAIVAAVIRTITVATANPRKKWDPDRFTIGWIA
ncbi:serine recombinase [Sphaerisporangium melleum]|uniref:Serine recombinase n=1 Tax=Sphaerisporangium melleum TaxID=321316 RepID=A0A917RCL4_9ACTN|nr:recombinase family protein [Sphaerisporangium melleum]GGK99732.1 serine recombinase [Sphaerisporangium melleum]GII73631.1 serine recombinase [Sphaerisporangium melleum]